MTMMTLSVRVAVLCAVLALVSDHVLGSFRIVTPAREAPAEIVHELALFGRPKYGAGLVAPLALAPRTNVDACEPFDDQVFHPSLASFGIAPVVGDSVDGVVTEPFVLLVERGNCHFVRKVRNAQAVGAAAVVIYNTGDDSVKLPVLADDGTGGDVHIPSLLVHHREGNELVELLRAGTKTVVAINWDVPHQDDRVEVSLWFSSRSSSQLHAFLQDFRPVVAALGNSILFAPFYDVHAGSEWGCSQENSDARPTHCPQLCVYNEMFCTYDPERNNTIGLDGKDVLEEDVRQLCVYQHSMASTGNTSLFFEYLVKFNAKCSVPDATPEQFNKKCSKMVQEELGIPQSVFGECTDNPEQGQKLLQAQLDALHKFHVINFPEVTVNGIPMYGSLACEPPISLSSCTPLEMICAGFADNHVPQACRKSFWESADSECISPLERDDCGVCGLRQSVKWNAQCLGCDGVLYSGKHTDVCGICGGDGSFDVCGRCLPATEPSRDKSCQDCKGVPNGFALHDACGVCDGHGSFDACGLCLDAADPRRQNFACHVSDDPEAVQAKLEIEGIGMKQFRGDILRSFQVAVGFAVNVEPDQVLVKTVDERPSSSTRATSILFFVACESEDCRLEVAKRLQDPSASLAIAMKMKVALDEKAYGMEASKSVGQVLLHSVISTPVTAGADEPLKRAGSTQWVGIAIACGMTLAVGVVMMRVRDDRMRRDFRELFARYTPLTTMDYEEESEHGRQSVAGAEAW